MPNPKTGTVTTDVAKAVDGVQGRPGRVPHRPLRQRPRARSARPASSPTKLIENFRAVLDELNRAKPASAKGRYIRKVAVSTTMGPGIKVDPARLRDDAVARPGLEAGRVPLAVEPDRSLPGSTTNRSPKTSGAPSER